MVFKIHLRKIFNNNVYLFLESIFLGFILCLPFFFDHYTWVLSLFSLIVFFYRLDDLVTNKFKFHSYFLLFCFSWYIACSHPLFMGLYIVGDVSLLLSTFCFLLIGFMCLCYFSILSILWLKQRYLAIEWRLFSFVICWALLEWTRLWLFTGYSLMSLGYFHTTSLFNGYAPLGGNLMVSIAVLSFALLISARLRKYISLKICIFSCAIILLVGFLSHLYPWSQPLDGKGLKVALVQTGQTMEQRINIKNETRNSIVTNTQSWLKHVDSDTELIITPEGYLGEFISLYSDDFFMLFRNWAKNHNAGLMLGTTKQIGQFLEHGYYYFVSIFASHQELLSSQENNQNWWQSPQHIYQKQNLIPFVEYMPTWSKYFIQYSWFPQGDGEIGPQKKVLWQIKPDYWIAPSICYDFYFGHHIRNNSIDANLLVNQAYQGWFEHSFGPEILQRVARMRALESAKPVVRVDGYGISSIISHTGKDILILPQGKTHLAQKRVIGYKGKTLYYQFGFKVLICLFIIIAIFLALYSYQTKRLKR